jgi:uncharacterized delta-60 repeat protein
MIMLTVPSWSRPIALVVAVACVVLAGLVAVAPVQAAPGDLDVSFGAGGKMITDFGDQESGASVALQPDGKIVAAGSRVYWVCVDNVWCGFPAQFALARYQGDDGLPDASFGDGGTRTTEFGAPEGGVFSDGGANAVAVQPNGKIVAVGSAPFGAFGVARYNVDGSLDRSFARDGTLTAGFGGPAYDVVLESDENPYADRKIVVVGQTGEGNFALARYNADGSLDDAFGRGGTVTIDFAGWEVGPSVALQHDGKIVVAGTTVDGRTGKFALARYNADGSPDDTFGLGGKQTTEFSVRHDAKAVAIQTDGKVVVAGSAQSDDGGDFALARYNSDGSLDRPFGIDDDGEQATSFGGQDYARAVAIQPDGKIVAIGQSANDFAIARYNADGSPDEMFGLGGKQTTDFGAGSVDGASDVALQPDGKIVAVGTSNNNFALVRYQGGTLPVNSSPPTISGTATEGQTLTVNAGTWSGNALTPRYQWRRCDSAGANCLNITEATAANYVLARADVGHTIRVRETVTNASADSAPTTVVLAKPGTPPVNGSPPTISGTTTQGQTLNATRGTWTGSSITLQYGYRWRRCDTAGANCRDITGASGAAYVLVAADVGHTIRVRETATSDDKYSSSADSAATGVVKKRSPAR